MLYANCLPESIDVSGFNDPVWVISVFGVRQGMISLLTQNGNVEKCQLHLLRAGRVRQILPEHYHQSLIYMR
jgi:hypothetical protein